MSKTLASRLGAPKEIVDALDIPPTKNDGGNSGEGNEGGAGEGGQGNEGGEGDGNPGGENQNDQNQGQQGQQQPDKTPEELQAEEDERTLAYINKRRGTDFKTLDEALAPQQAPVQEDEETKKKNRRKQILKFAIDQNIIPDTEDYDNFQRDSAKDPRDLVFADFYNRRKTAGRTDEQIEAEFSKMYGEDLDESDDVNAFVKAQQNEALKKESERIIGKKYPWHATIESKYEEHVKAKTLENEQLTEGKRIATTYVNDVNEIFETTKSRKIKVVDNETNTVDLDYDFEFKPELIDKAKKEFLKRETLLGFIANGYNKDALKEAINLHLQKSALDAMIAHSCKKYYETKMKKKEQSRKNLTQETIASESGGGQGPTGVMGERLARAGYKEQPV